MREIQRKENEEAEIMAQKLQHAVKQKKIELKQANAALREQRQRQLEKEAQLDKEIEGNPGCCWFRITMSCAGRVRTEERSRKGRTEKA